ncbi:hypothetical protein BE17_49440 [Sorangium cellulosum]|uniref:Uncharacterized protein n=1 Tax=Sorangium cellulosum TaxID=56 RepID=A0A150RWT7_SORCE|nr:hypothetical protein BE17_49440 [Sorangium cellulosum]
MCAAQNGRQLADACRADFAREVIQVNLDAGDGSPRAGVHLDPAAAVCSGTKQRDAGAIPSSRASILWPQPLPRSARRAP